MTTVVIGAGIAGLAAALELSEGGEEFVLVEQANRVGGVISSARDDGFLLERGPRTIAGNAPTLARLIEAAGLRDQCRHSKADAQRRYVFSRGELHALPHGLAQLWTSRLLSWSAKARILAEPLVPRGGHPLETIEGFVSRRFGKAASERLADPMCAGIFGALPARLGIDALGRAAQLELDYGSVLTGMLRSARLRRQQGGPIHSLLSFDEGLQQLTDALGLCFTEQQRRGTKVTAIEPRDGGFIIHCQQVVGDEPSSETLTADRLILAVPAPAAARLLEPLDQQAAKSLQSIEHAPLAVVALGFRSDAISHPLDGFGVLRCSDSPLPAAGPILGLLFSSSIFDGRAPAGSVLLEVMIGGSRDPGALNENDASLLRRATRAATSLLGINEEPCFQSITRWAPVLPQYAPGHKALIEGVEESVARLGPLALAGNYLRGVGVEGAAASGIAAATRLLAT